MSRSYSITKIVVFVIIMYLFVFQGIINRYIFIGLEFLVAILFFRKEIGKYLPLFKKELLFCLIILSYSVMRDILHGEIVYSDRFFAAFFQGYFVSIILTSHILKNADLCNNFNNILVGLVAIGAVLTFMAILNPSIDSIFSSINYEYSAMLERYANLDVRYRAYGLSESLTFSYPYVLAVVGSFIMMEKRNIYTIVVLLLIVIAVMYNARIAFFPLFFTVPILLIRRSLDIKALLKAAIFIMLLLVVINNLSIFSNSWALSFFDEMEQARYGQSDTLNTMFGEMFFLPDESSLTLVFGTGISMFSHSGKESDVGWVLQMYYGGFVLLMMIVLYMLFMFKRLIKVLHLKHWFTLMFIFSLPLLNTKGFFFASTPGCRFFTFLYVFYIMKRYLDMKKLTLPRKISNG